MLYFALTSSEDYIFCYQHYSQDDINTYQEVKEK